MAQINFSKRTLTCKLVYYGPGVSGKTTNLERIYDQIPENRRGELTSIATHGDRTIFYDYVPVDVGKVAGLTTRLQLYTVPGQPYYKATRKLVLVGADGVVFVADSQSERLGENVESLQELSSQLAEQGKDIANFPLVFAWNKRDLPNALPTEQLNVVLNRHDSPAFETVAAKGEGVFSALREISRLVLQEAKREYESKGPPKPSPKPKPASAPIGLSDSQDETSPYGVKGASRHRPAGLSDAVPMAIPLDTSSSSIIEPIPMPLERTIGQTVGGCVILAKLGEGGMGDVYLARHKALGKDFVVKTLKPDRRANRTSVKRFFMEARATASLEHENVVRVQDVGTTAQGMHYMIMQHVDGLNLEDKVSEEGPFEPREAARIALEVAKALEATHSAGVVHRDVKPQNVILGNDGSVTLIDFGLARNLTDNTRLTRQGGLVGTPAYMAPEMMAREDIDGRVDIFALGLTFYFLITGEAPFLGSDIHDLFLGKARLKAPELYKGKLSASYRYALQRLLAKDRQDRYPNAKAAIRELTVLAGGGELNPTSGDGTEFWLWQRADGSSLDLPRAPAHPVRNTTDDLISDLGRESPPPAPPPAPKAPKAPKAPSRPKPAKERTPRPPAPPTPTQTQLGAENPLVREIERAARNPANRIEECVLLSTLEEGSIGTLHRAWDIRESRLVAVRVIEGLQSLQAGAVESLHRIQALNHPRIPKLRRFGLSDEHELYLITDLVRGRSIRSYRHKPKSVVIAIRDVAQALHHANAAGAFHGSLLPECVMIDKDGAGHLLDFGLHHALEHAIAGGSIRLPRISSRYKPPERLRSHGPGDARSEVYGLGAVFYYGLARQPPGTGDVVAPRKLRGGIPRPIQDICLRCLKHAPNERYPDAGVLGTELDAFIQIGPRRRR